MERKRSKEYLVIILAVKESFERFSCLEFTFEKSKHWEASLRADEIKLWLTSEFSYRLHAGYGKLA